MGPLAKTLAVAGTLGAAYVAVRYFSRQEDNEREPTSSADAPDTSGPPASSATAAPATPPASTAIAGSPATPPASSATPPASSAPSSSPGPSTTPPSSPAPVTTAPRPVAPPGPQASPGAALPEPRHPKLHQVINHSTVDDAMTVRESATELLTQARRFDPAVTLDELTAARLAASEHGSGSFTELCCIIDAELNRATRRRQSLFDSLTHHGTFGKQGKTRRASTRRDPEMRHLLAARAVFAGQARGIARGAVRFFDPKAQLDAHRRWQRRESDRKHCHPLIVLERWAFDLEWAKGGEPCALERTRLGKDKQEWIGPLAGVDPMHLMLMRPATAQHREQYEAALELISERFGMPMV